MKRLLKGLLILGFIFLPLTIFAQWSVPNVSQWQSWGASFTFAPKPTASASPTTKSIVESDTTAIFNLPVTDPSYIFLGQLFGTVGPVLHGTSGQMLGTLFQYFNLGILVVAGIFLLWTTIKVLIHASQEGTFMGKEVNAGFHIIRTVLGIGLLAPSTAGYSIIQIIVMWAVLQGAGFANTAWDAALDYLQQGGQVLVPPSNDVVPMLDMAGTVLEANLCMYYHEKLEKDLQTDAKAQIQSGNTSPIFTDRAAFFPAYQPFFNAATSTVNFPASRGNNPADAGCGQFNYAQPAPVSYGWSGGSYSQSADVQRQATNTAYVGQALQQVISSLSSVARQMVYSGSSFSGQVTSPTGTGTVSQMESMVQLALVGAAQDWVNLTAPVRSQGQGGTILANFYKVAKQDGWLYAGSYYYQLSTIQRSLYAAQNVSFSMPKPPTCIAGGQSRWMTFPGISVVDCSTINTSYQSSGSPSPSFENMYKTAATYVGNSKSLAAAAQSASGHTTQVPTAYFPSATGQFIDALITPMTYSLSHGLQLIHSPADPILKVQVMGVILIESAIGTWISFAIAYFAMSLIFSTMSSISSVGYAIRDMVFFFVPLYMALLGVLLSTGMVCVVYVPLIPFITYTFTALGWLIHVMEAMVAAPLVALGVTHPEGQGFLGKGEQAIMLLLGVFIRPVCMVLGLLGGMMLSYIGLQMLNYPFLNVIANIIRFSTSSTALMGLEGAIVGIYVVLVVQIVSQAYNLIFHIPDRVLRWLGQQVETGGVGAALQAAEAHGKAVGEAGARSMTMPGGGGGGGGGPSDEGEGEEAESSESSGTAEVE